MTARVSKDVQRRLDAARKLAETPVNLTGRYTEQQLWGHRTYIKLTDDTPKVAVCCNFNRNTCIRISVGRKKTAYIPMDASGLRVVRASHEAFKHEWTSLLVEYTPQVAAQIYLRSIAASYYISEEARTLLEEISRSGAPTSTIQEHEIMASKTKPAAKKAAKAKAPATKTSSTKKATKPKTAAASDASLGRPGTASTRFKELIMKGTMTDDAIFDKVASEFGLDEKKRSYVKWYRNDLAKHGHKPPAAK